MASSRESRSSPPKRTKAVRKVKRSNKAKKSSKKRYDSYSNSSASAHRVSSHVPNKPKTLRPLTSQELRMNQLCETLGLSGGEYRDGYYVRYVGVSQKAAKPKTIYKDKIVYVDVPDIEYVERPVDRVSVKEVIKHVPRVVEVPKEHIKYVPKVKTKTRTVDVPIPGRVVDNPVPFEVPNMVLKPTFHDQEQEVLVAQVLKPTIHVNKGSSHHVEAYAIDPVLHAVDVYVPFPVQSTLKLTAVDESIHKKVDIPEAHYNALVNRMNDTVPDDYRASLFKTKAGKKGDYIPMLPPHEHVQVVPRHVRW